MWLITWITICENKLIENDKIYCILDEHDN